MQGMDGKTISLGEEDSVRRTRRGWVQGWGRARRVR